MGFNLVFKGLKSFCEFPFPDAVFHIYTAAGWRWRNHGLQAERIFIVSSI